MIEGSKAEISERNSAGEVPYVQIPLNRGFILLIDVEDLCKIDMFNWKVEVNRKIYFSVTAFIFESGVRSRVYLTSLILPAPAGFLTLMRNKGDREKTFDFRKSNLYIGSIKDRNRARRKLQPKSSIYRGVHYSSKSRLWRAIIKIDGKIINLGSFQREMDAAQAYDEAAVRYFGRTSFQNFPNL